MSQENVEIARAALNWFAQLDEGLVDQEGWGEFFTDDVLATFSGFGVMDEQTLRGLEFLEFRASWMEPYDDWLYETKEIFDAGASQVVVLLHQRGRPHGSDSWVEMDYGMVYTVEQRLISRANFYADPEQALEAAGLREKAMSQENVETARQAIEAFDRRDRTAWLALHDRDHEVVPDRDFPEAGAIRGRDAAWDFFVNVFGAFERRPIGGVEVVDAGVERVLIHYRLDARGRASGAEVEIDYWDVVAFREGRIVQEQLFTDRAEALEAAGLRE